MKKPIFPSAISYSHTEGGMVTLLNPTPEMFDELKVLEKGGFIKRVKSVEVGV